MATDKLTTLEQLRTASERAKNYITESTGEANVIEGITVNGVDATITNKVATLTIDIPTTVSALTNDAGYQTASDVSDAIAKVVADADSDFDTLKEIADWINNHSDSASEMNTKITANETDIANLKTLIGELPSDAQSSTVVAYIAELVGSIETYVHPSYTAYDSGFYKITTDDTGHVVEVVDVTADDIAALGYEIATDSDVSDMLDDIFGSALG